MGDSKTPLVSLAISSVVNILLDIVFLAWLDMGIGGAALATVIAQIFSAGWNFYQLMRRGNVLPRLRHFKLQWYVMKELLRLSLPQMLSSAVINSGGLLVQRIINSHGVEFVMGLNASGRIFSTYGPMSKPATRYPVTFGRPIFFTMRLNRRPTAIATPIQNRIFTILLQPFSKIIPSPKL